MVRFRFQYNAIKIIVNANKTRYYVVTMILIVGLGNPGEKFNHTPHNAGFEVLDFFAIKNNFPEFTESKKYESLISEKDGVILAKPQTFMNESGRAVKKLLSNVNDQVLIVIHDDIDVSLGKIKVSKESGAGGHKGVASIIEALGTKQFMRIKIGVEVGPEKAEEVVLKKFTPEQYEVLQSAFPEVAKTLEAL